MGLRNFINKIFGSSKTETKIVEKLSPQRLFHTVVSEIELMTFLEITEEELMELRIKYDLPFIQYAKGQRMYEELALIQWVKIHFRELAKIELKRKTL